MSTSELSLTISWFDTAFPKGPALGMPERMTWKAFTEVLHYRREGEKDGPNFIPAIFRPEPDGQVRRLKNNLIARSAIALDCETSKATGEVPPAFEDAVARVTASGFAAVVYTSHNHTLSRPRYRIALPLTAEIDHRLPAVEVIAAALDLSGVLDTGKLGASSLFYLPSCEFDREDDHETAVIDGAPIDATWITECAGKLVAAREAEQDRQRTQALEAAIARREERVKQGSDPSDTLIEKIRPHLDLAGVLLRNGYAESAFGNASKYLYPHSETGVPGVHILKGNDGIERVFSHHSGDPLAKGNLPSWCHVAAVDAVDAVIILEFASDRTAALRLWADRFELTKTAEKKTLAALIFRSLRQQTSQPEIEAAAKAEGERLGLSWSEVCSVAAWVSDQAVQRREAA